MTVYTNLLFCIIWMVAIPIGLHLWSINRIVIPVSQDSIFVIGPPFFMLYTFIFFVFVLVSILLRLQWILIPPSSTTRPLSTTWLFKYLSAYRSRLSWTCLVINTWKRIYMLNICTCSRNFVSGDGLWRYWSGKGTS